MGFALCLVSMVVGLAIWGFVAALIAGLPPIYKLARRFPLMRRVVCANLGIFAALVVLIVFGDLAVQIRFYDSDLPIDSQTLKLELGLRQIAPSIFSGTCISGDVALCQLADDQMNRYTFSTSGYLFLFVLSPLIAALTAGRTAWWFTEPSQDEAARARFSLGDIKMKADE